MWGSIEVTLTDGRLMPSDHPQATLVRSKGQWGELGQRCAHWLRGNRAGGRREARDPTCCETTDRGTRLITTGSTSVTGGSCPLHRIHGLGFARPLTMREIETASRSLGDDGTAIRRIASLPGGARPPIEQSRTRWSLRRHPYSRCYKKQLFCVRGRILAVLAQPISLTSAYRKEVSAFREEV